MGWGRSAPLRALWESAEPQPTLPGDRGQILTVPARGHLTQGLHSCPELAHLLSRPGGPGRKYCLQLCSVVWDFVLGGGCGWNSGNFQKDRLGPKEAGIKGLWEARGWAGDGMRPSTLQSAGSLLWLLVRCCPSSIYPSFLPGFRSA